MPTFSSQNIGSVEPLVEIENVVMEEALVKAWRLSLPIGYAWFETKACAVHYAILNGLDPEEEGVITPVLIDESYVMTCP